jgi:hypothetical protein
VQHCRLAETMRDLILSITNRSGRLIWSALSFSAAIPNGNIVMSLRHRVASCGELDAIATKRAL